jgi:hypothetical protein
LIYRLKQDIDVIPPGSPLKFAGIEKSLQIPFPKHTSGSCVLIKLPRFLKINRQKTAKKNEH